MVSTLPPYHRFKVLIKGKVLPRCGRKMTLSDSIAFLSIFFFCLHFLCVLLYFQVSLVLCFALFNMFLFSYFLVLLCFVFHIKKMENKKNTKTVCILCTLVPVYRGWLLKQSFLNFVSFVT